MPIPPRSPPHPHPPDALGPPNSLPPSLLERYFAQHEFSTPLLACCSDVEPLTIHELLEISAAGKEKNKGTTPEEEQQQRAETATSSSFGGLSLGYLDPRGAPRLREAVAREHGGCGGGRGDSGGGGGGQEDAVTADDVLVAAPQELAYLLQRALLQGKREREAFLF